jgi:hypothetical protein
MNHGLKRPHAAQAPSVDKRPFGRPGPSHDEVAALRASNDRLEQELNAQKAVMQTLQMALQAQLQTPPQPQVVQTSPKPAAGPFLIKVEGEPMEEEPSTSTRQATPDDDQCFKEPFESNDEDIKPKVEKKLLMVKTEEGEEDQKPKYLYKKKPIPKGQK